MLAVSGTGIPEIICDGCREAATLEICLIMKHPDLAAIQLVCLDCAEKLKEKYPSAKFAMAQLYFESILTRGRPVRVFPVGS